MSDAATRRVVERLRPHTRRLRSLPDDERKTLIQLAIMDAGSTKLDPDDENAIGDIERRLWEDDEPPQRPLLPRVEEFTGLSHGEIAKLIGKGRSTVQAYISGRLNESLDPDARRNLARVVENRMAEVDHLLRELLKN